MLTSKDILQFLRTNKQMLQKEYHCSEIGLFGSFARNEQTNISDIDILVEFEENTPNLYDIEIKLKNHLKKTFGREIDICSKKWIKPIFKQLIIKEALYV